MAQRSFDVAALGELLIDFTENGISDQGNPIFEATPAAPPAMCWPCWPSWAKKPPILSAGRHHRDHRRGGDTFCAGVLNYILEHGIEDLTESDLDQMLRFANAAA